MYLYTLLDGQGMKEEKMTSVCVCVFILIHSRATRFYPDAYFSSPFVLSFSFNMCISQHRVD